MDYTEVMEVLQKSSLYDLFRIRVAINNELDNPDRIKAIRQRFMEGDQISYFDSAKNRLSKAIVLQKNQKYVLLRDLEDHQTWNVPYYMLNIEGKDSDIRINKQQKLTKNHLKVGEVVGFDHDGKQYIGTITKLNYKTASLLLQDGKRYRVSYGMLFKVIDSERSYNNAKIIDVLPIDIGCQDGTSLLEK